jgi:hypothetical protein
MTKLFIRFGYQWAKVPLSEDPKYKFLKQITGSGVKSIGGMVGENGERVEAVCTRLRGRHGALILDDIRSRIRSADVLLFDLNDENANVMLELGIALAKPEDGQFIFILMKEGAPIPSDLSGYLISFYKETEDYVLVDPHGFHAALRSALIQRAYGKAISLKWDVDTSEGI